MASYKGIGGTVYNLQKEISSGGEGTVYTISDPSLVAKIYKPQRFKTPAERSTMERKLLAMIKTNIKTTIDGMMRLAWPIDVLYENGEMVGFIMPKVNSSRKIYDIYRGGRNSVRNREHPDNDWKYLVIYSYNLAWIVNYLHENGIVIGDLNQNNIIVDTQTGAVILIDCDSFDITDKTSGEHFPCEVGLEEILAPELQSVNVLKMGKFTKESDIFSMAIHIFRLLMNNENPFGGISSNQSSSSMIAGNRDIIIGDSPYYTSKTGKKLPPRCLEMSFLPPEIEALFKKTFDYNERNAVSKIKERPPARKWAEALALYGAPEPNPRLKRCQKNRRHVYPAHNKSCPWCAISKHTDDPFSSPNATGVSQIYTGGGASSGGQNTGAVARSNTGTANALAMRGVTAGTINRPYRQAPTIIRRKPTLLYTVMLIFGVISGFVFGDIASNLLTSSFDVSFSSTLCTSVMSVLGVIAAILTANWIKDKYIRANNAIPWLLLSLGVLAAPPIAVAALALVAALVLGILYIIGGLIVIFLIFSFFWGS